MVWRGFVEIRRRDVAALVQLPFILSAAAYPACLAARSSRARAVSAITSSMLRASPRSSASAGSDKWRSYRSAPALPSVPRGR